MNRLTELANKYESDKGTNLNTENEFVHGFTRIYNTFFKQFINIRPVILEIGVWHGASVKMINEYYNGNCEVYCFDVDESLKSYIEDIGENIHFYKIDQGNIDQLNDFIKEMNEKNIKFNLIIDDGSHVLYHQIVTLLNLYKLIDTDNGYYIVEDCHTCYEIERYKDFKYGLNEQYSILNILTFFKAPNGLLENEINRLLRDIKSVVTYNNIEDIKLLEKANTIDKFRQTRSLTCIISFLSEKKEED